MKALVKAKKEVGLWMMDVPKPTVGPNDVLIKIKKTAICGTDLHIYNWDAWAQKTIKVPMHVGHEFVGEIVELGTDVKGLAIGERVSGEGHITCRYCRNCHAGKGHLCRHIVNLACDREGAFAEYLSFPATNVVKIPNSIDDDVASMMDALGNAVLTALTFDLVGEDVLITGAGPIGCMAVAIAKHVGARHVVITDVNEYRLDLARKMGATLAINPQHTSLGDVMTQLGMTEGFDVGLEMSGNATAVRSMLEYMNNGGKIAFLGIPPEDFSVNWHYIIFKCLTIKGVYGREMFETWYKMIAMLQSGLNVKPVITHHYKAEDFQQAFDAIASGNSGKIILSW